MARVTIEDSLSTIKKVEGWGIFHMIVLAAGRAHQLQHGAQARLPWNGDKPTVLALREIAAGHIDFTEEKIPTKDHFGQVIEEKANADDTTEESGTTEATAEVREA